MAQRRTGHRRAKEVPRFSQAARRAKAARSGPAWAQPADQSRPWWARRREQDLIPQPVVQLSGRKAEALARQMLAAQLAAGQLQMPGQPGLPAVPGQLPAVPMAQRIPVRPPRQAWRFRKQLQPFIWLALLLAAGAGLSAAPHRALLGWIAATLVPVLMWWTVSQRGDVRKHYFLPWTRRFVLAQAAVTGVWLLLMALAGFRACAAFVLLSGLPFLGLWVRRYRWRPQARPAEAAPAAPDQDAATWAALSAARKWTAALGPREDLPDGARMYPVQCDGIKTTMDEILAAPRKVAGAYHRAMTECYAERDPLGVESRGSLTILSGSSLINGRFWGQQGLDPVTGTAITGRFADGKDVHDKWVTERYGCDHELVSGTTGSGKSSRLDLAIFIALVTGWFVPVILDPQEGQSLPFWRERCIYAAGEGQVMRRIRGLHAAFMDRSSFLSTLRWTDQTDAGPVEMPGMPFYDYQILASMGLRLPVVMPVLDEAHTVLKDGNKEQRLITASVVEMARLVRKAGGRMVLATQLPGLADLGGSQALRDMLRGGTVWSGRTANKVSGGMLGLVKDPSEIPRFFPGGLKTSGLGYTDGWDARPDAPMRTDRPPAAAYANPPSVPQLDDRFMEVMEAATRESVSPTATVAAVTAAPAAAPVPQQDGQRRGLLRLVKLPAAPAPEPAEAPEPEGRRCIDAVQLVLRGGQPMDRGQVIAAVSALSEQWGRPKPWSIKAVGMALRELVDTGQLSQPVKGGPYQARS